MPHDGVKAHESVRAFGDAVVPVERWIGSERKARAMSDEVFEKAPNEEVREEWSYQAKACPTLENILGRHTEHDLADRLVVQDAPLALLRDRVDVAQTAFERIFFEHRHRAAIVKQRIDDLP